MNKHTNLFFALILITFYSCNDACRFNIDRYELMTGIGIPELVDADCIVDEGQNINISIFKIDTLALKNNKYYPNLDQYIAKNKFYKPESATVLKGKELVPDEYKSALSSNNMYQAEGKYDNKQWILILDKNTGIMIGQTKQ